MIIMKRSEFLPYCLPAVGNEEIDEVVDTLKSGWLTMGPKTIKFEGMIANYCGTKHAVSVNSCTAALHLCLLGYDIGPGDEVITSPYTFAATGNVIVHTGARPVLVDVDKRTCNITPDNVRRAITKKTKAIIPVHFAGQPCEMDEIMEIAEENDLVVIEDAAHAIGAEYKGKKIGGIGHATCHSFYATKNMTTGEGGAVTTNDDRLADRIRILRLHGISRDAWQRYSATGNWYYEIEECGWKCNMTDIQASLGMHQLNKLDSFIQIRREYAKVYNDLFSAIPQLITPYERNDVMHPYHIYPLVLDGVDRNGLIEFLKANNVGTSVHFIPLHLHPFYMRTFGFARGAFPNAEWVYDREISLPLFPTMTREDLEYIVSKVIEFVKS